MTKQRNSNKVNYPKVICLSEAFRGMEISLFDKDHLLIGRSPDTDFKISDPTVSGHHCVLSKIDGNVFSIQDLDSTNGTTLNGTVLKHHPSPLKSGDVIRVGSIELFYEDGLGSGAFSTKTVIDLEAGNKSRLRNQKNFSPFYKDRDGNPTVVIAIRIILGVLGILAAAAVYYLMLALMS